MDPTQAGFLDFIRNVMGVPVQALSDSAPIIGFVYNVALNLANQAFRLLPNANQALPNLYATLVYNLAADFLINFAPDDPSAPAPYNTFWTDLRATLKINSPAFGIISSASDQGTSTSYMIPESLNNLTLADLQNLKTPYGRFYLGLAQSFGPSVWGLT